MRGLFNHQRGKKKKLNFLDSAIASHPVGAKALRDKVQTLVLSWGPAVDMSQRLTEPCKVSLQPGNTLLISFRALHDAVVTRRQINGCAFLFILYISPSQQSANYKARVEFELGIVVAVAEHDATARRQAVSAALGGLPLNYSLDSFQNSDEFRFGVAISGFFVVFLVVGLCF